jgi:carbonic anhydrase
MQGWLTILVGLTLGCAGGSPDMVGADQGAKEAGEAQAVHWGYGDQDGPERWAELSPDWAACGTGMSQSPIDIPAVTDLPEADEISGRSPEAKVRVIRREHVLNVLDNGHTVQVNVDAGDTLTLGDQVFDLLQYHFHSPSEHTVDGEHYPMEMHLVHRSNAGDLAVIGVFIREGERNPAFDAVWNSMPLETGKEVRLERSEVNIDDMLPAETTSWRYEGSLTTPPCSEGVHWIVMQTPIQLDAAQIERFRQEFTGNNRPPQPLHDRPMVTGALLVE